MCGDGVVPAFLVYALAASAPRLLAATEEAAHGTKRLDIDLMRSLDVPVPPVRKQRRVAEYLNREIARIDAFERAKRRLLEVLGDRQHPVFARRNG